MRYAVAIAETQDGKTSVLYHGHSRVAAKDAAREVYVKAPPGVVKVIAFGDVGGPIFCRRMGAVQEQTVTTDTVEQVEQPKPAKPAKA